MKSTEHVHALQMLADEIKRRHWITPAILAIDTLRPLAFIASQFALFLRPFTPLGRWHEYVRVLEHEESWQLLHHLLDQQDG